MYAISARWHTSFLYKGTYSEGVKLTKDGTFIDAKPVRGARHHQSIQQVTLGYCN